MKNIEEILKNIPDGKEVFTKFFDGNCFGLADFEMVDESIYQRTDVCMCDIITIICDDRNVLRAGNKIEFYINDIIQVKDLENENILYEKLP